MVLALVTSLIPENELLITAESTLSTEIEPYQFEPTTVACYSDEDSNSDESDTDVQEQASFTERLGKVDWCSWRWVKPGGEREWEWEWEISG